MKQYKPAYYDSFRCIASDCPDTCCQEWDIQVDPETAAYYSALPGDLGEQIRSSLHKEDGETVITLRDNRCPMQSAEGLCQIQCRLGEQALCQVCRDFPRLRHDYGSFLELGLELSCPEAARILLTSAPAPLSLEEVTGDSLPDYDTEAMEVLLSTRQQALALLSGTKHTPEEAMILFFFYGCHAQQLLDGEEPAPFDPAAALETAAAMEKGGDFSSLPLFFSRLEILTPEWEDLLKKAAKPQISHLSLALLRYLVSRYWLQAVSDYDLYCRVKFMLISCLLVSSLPGDFIWNAHLYSKEIENDIDNVDALLDGAYGDPCFTDDKLLGYLLEIP